VAEARQNSGCGVLLFVSMASCAGPIAIGQEAEPYKFFHEYVGLKDDQIQQIRQGKAIAKVIESRTADEIFVFGAVYIEGNPESYLKMVSDVDALRKLPSYLAIKKFSDPPQASDLEGFTLEKDDVKDLKNCKPGHCDVQLPSESMEEFQKGVNWSAPEQRIRQIDSDKKWSSRLWRVTAKGETRRSVPIVTKITRRMWERLSNRC